MARIEVSHIAGARYEIRIRDHALTVDQPVDAGGGDAGPTPTELFVASLASCMAYYAGRFFERHSLPAEGLRVSCDYRGARSPARVGSVEVTIEAPGLPPERVEAFRRVVDHCTVHNSLRHTPEVTLRVTDAALIR